MTAVVFDVRGISGRFVTRFAHDHDVATSLFAGPMPCNVNESRAINSVVVLDVRAKPVAPKPAGSPDVESRTSTIMLNAR